MLRIIKKDETVVPATTFQNGNAKVTFTVSAKTPVIPEHVGEVTFDFAGVSNDAIKALAVDGLVIKLQSRLRTAWKKKEGGGSAGMLKVGAIDVVKVAAFIAERARVDKVEKGKSLIAGMTPEQRKEMAKLLASMK